jgi:hypothetical protein
MSKKSKTVEPSDAAKSTSKATLAIEQQRLRLEKKSFKATQKSANIERQQLREQTAQNNQQLSLLQSQVALSAKSAQEYSTQLVASDMLATDQAKQAEMEAKRGSLLQQVQAERAGSQANSLLRRVSQRRTYQRQRLTG